MSKNTSSEFAGSGAEGDSNDAHSKESNSARDRTLRHMRKLLIKSAAAGATLSTTGCPPIVCDPLPPPVDCTSDLTNSNISLWMSSQAQWAQKDSGIAVDVTVSLYASELTFSGQPALECATLLESEILETRLTFRCLPSEGATEVAVSVPIQCEDVSGDLQLMMDVRGLPEPGRVVPVTMTTGSAPQVPDCPPVVCDPLPPPPAD